MPRTVSFITRITALLAALVFIAVAGAVSWFSYDTRHQADTLEYVLGRWLQRDLQIGELIESRFGEDTYLVATDVSLSNPSWAEHTQMATVSQLILHINLPSLWRQGPVLIHQLDLAQAQLNLEAPEDESPSWIFWPERERKVVGDDTPFPVIISSGRVDTGTIRYLDPDQDVTAQLSQIALQQQGESQNLGLEIAGEVNGLPLSVQGQAGPLRALTTGRELSMDLAVELGEFSLSSHGRAKDLRRLEGLDLRLTASSASSRPILDLFGLSEMRDGPFSLAATLTPTGSGFTLDATGKLEDFDLSVAGEVARPREVDGLDLDVELGGPSLREIGAALDLEGLPDTPYRVVGKVGKQGSLLTLTDGSIQAKESRVHVSGEFPEFPEIDDWKLSVKGDRIDLALVGSYLGLEDIPEQPYAIEGSFGSNDAGIELIELQLSSATGEMILKGIVGEAPSYSGTDLELTLTGDDMAVTAPWVGLEKIPQEAFSLEGRVQYLGGYWQLTDGELKSPSLAVVMNGTMDRMINASKVSLDIGFSAPDLSETLAAYGVETRKDISLPVEFRGLVEGTSTRLRLRNGEATLNKHSLAVAGELGDLRHLEQVKLDLGMEGPDLRKVIPIEFPGSLEPIKYDVTGKLGFEPGVIHLHALEASLPSEGIRATGGTEFHMGAGLTGVESRLHISGESTLKLERLLDIETGAGDRPFSIEASIVDSASQTQISPLSMTFGESDLSGSISLQWREKTRLIVDLHTRHLHLPFLLPDLEELEREKLAEEETGLGERVEDLRDALTDAELEERLIPDTPMKLDRLRNFDAELRYRLDEVYFRPDATTEVSVDLSLKDGVLQSRSLSWNGSLSSGEAELSLNVAEQPSQIEFSATGERLPVSWLLSGDLDDSGQSMYRVRLNASGDTPRALATSLNGAMVYRGGGGRMDNAGMDLVMGDVLSEVVDTLNPATSKSPYTDVECTAGAVMAVDGRLEVIPGLVMRTTKFDYVSAGAINLHHETYDLAFSTRSRKGIGISAGKAVTNYVKLGGTLANPRLTLDPMGAAISGGAAVATAGWSIVATSMWDRWVASSGDPCKRLLKTARKDKKRDYRSLYPKKGSEVNQ